MQKKDHFPELRETRILLVDDDPTIGDLIAEMLEKSVHELRRVVSYREAVESASAGCYDVALIDVNLPDGNGFDLITRLKQEAAAPSIIMITGLVDAAMANELERLGVQTLLTKPFSGTQLKFSICRELSRKKSRDGAFQSIHESELIGVSPYIREVRRKIREFASSNLPILISGPTGTGKEIIARAIHSHSSRWKKTMISVNSSAIPEHLEESEFFGYARGAFTGASQGKDGILRCADGSTLFLDEVGELSLRMQVKLLRVLDGHDFFRVGDTTPQKSDFRVISATNRSLPEMIRAGTFREDLYFRLKAAAIVTEPLTKHKEDIPVLINHFLKNIRKEKERDFTVSIDALEIFTHYTWPGNIRELKNTINTLCTISQETGSITRENILWVLSESAKGEEVPVIPFSDAKIDFERDYYRGLLIKFNGNISVASRAAGIERAYFSKRVRMLGLSKENLPAPPSEQETTHSSSLEQ